MGYCLAFPHVRFLLSNTPPNETKSVILQTTGSSSVLNVFSNLFGQAAVRNLIPFEKTILLHEKNEKDWSCSLNGYISKYKSCSNIRPKVMCGRGDTDRQFVFVNKYPMDIPKLRRAINQVYREFNSTQSPAIMLYLELPMERFDRNVTPDKRNLILENEDSLITLIKDNFTELFEPFRGEFQAVVVPKESVVAPKELKEVKPPRSISQTYLPSSQIAHSPRPRTSLISQESVQKPKSTSLPFRSHFRIDSEDMVSIDMKILKRTSPMHKNRGVVYNFADRNLETPMFVNKKDFLEMKVLGQFNLGFILVSFQNYLFIVDQHACKSLH